MVENPSHQQLRQGRWHGRIPITWALVIAIGLLMLITVSFVMGIGAWTAQKNTVNLLSRNAHQAVTAATDKIKTHLNPARFQVKFIADWIARKGITPGDQPEFGNILIAALAAAPQIEALLFINESLQSYGAGRLDGKIGLNKFDYTKDPDIIKAMKAVATKAGWGAPVWREKFNKTYLYYAHPVIVDDKFIGAMVAVVSIQELSRFVSESGLIAEGRRFLLYGQNHILAHWILVNGYADRSAKNPLPRLTGFSDPILAAIWKEKDRYTLDLPLPQGTRGHVLDIFNSQYVFIYQHLEGFGPQPIIVGVYYLSSDVSKELQRLVYSVIAGIFALVISLIIVVFVGRRITRPIVHFSKVANQIRDLDIAKVGYLPSNVFRELNDQSKAFNSMLQALHWFELYVPKKIVESLIKSDTRVGDDISASHEITVMFTDIVGFSSAAEGMTAQEVAAFVNEHFTLVAACIESEEGTIDKFIGDSVMAFWGAPERQSDSADRACRAALAMRKKIHVDNNERLSKGKLPIHIRIGIHTGPAIVGNIGSADRLNYTIIGDTVNIGQRLEQLAKKVYPADSEVSILISENTASLLGEEFDTTSAGQFKLKGRVNQIKIFKL